MRRKRIFSVILIFLILLVLSPGATLAIKRRLPRAGGSSISNSKTSGPSTKNSAAARAAARSIKVKFRADRRAIIAIFTNSDNVKSIDYVLSYKTRGKSEAVAGKIDPNLEAVSVRELVFGTASGGVYTYHASITNARFIVTTTLKNGSRYVKPYRLKI